MIKKIKKEKILLPVYNLLSKKHGHDHDLSGKEIGLYKKK